MNTEPEELDVPTQETDEPEQSAEEATLIPEDGPDQETADSEPEKPKPKGNDPERRISQYRARLSRAEEKAEYWRDQALRAKQAPKPQEPSDPEPKAPKLSDYQGDLEKFSEAQTRYVKDIRDYDRKQVQRAEENRRKEAEDRKRQAELTEREHQYLGVFDQGREKHEDFDDVVFDESLSLSQEVLDVSTDLENGAEVLYALAQKPRELARISGLTGRQVVLEVAKFANAMKPGPRGSGAPPPPKPAKGAGDSADQGELRDDLSAEEWIRRDRARRAKAGIR